MEFEFNFPELAPIDEKTLPLEERCRKKFYKYSGISEGRIIDKEDIKENWNNAFQRVMLETGVTKEGLYKILLNK